VHVVLRVTRAAGNLRKLEMYRAIRGALGVCLANRADYRVVHVSIQSTHLHLLVEADDGRALSRGMQGFAISAARRLNRALGRRRGQVFAYRYHATPITNPTQARNAISYVLNNWRRHRHDARAPWRIDPYSSADAFRGWAARIVRNRAIDLSDEAQGQVQLLLLLPAEVRAVVHCVDQKVADRLGRTDGDKQAVHRRRAQSASRIASIQTAARGGMARIELADGRFRFNPLVDWTLEDLTRYSDEHRLPKHPLVNDGYLSIGCLPCTRRVSAGEGYRAGRWAGLEKDECGMHAGVDGDGI
jgi:DNA-binding transcriptional regulator YdaS (Cro superfamily)/REP element-mobilizing transposase RayT